MEFAEWFEFELCWRWLKFFSESFSNVPVPVPMLSIKLYMYIYAGLVYNIRIRYKYIPVTLPLASSEKKKIRGEGGLAKGVRRNFSPEDDKITSDRGKATSAGMY